MSRNKRTHKKVIIITIATLLLVASIIIPIIFLTKKKSKPEESAKHTNPKAEEVTKPRTVPIQATVDKQRTIAEGEKLLVIENVKEDKGKTHVPLAQSVKPSQKATSPQSSGAPELTESEIESFPPSEFDPDKQDDFLAPFTPEGEPSGQEGLLTPIYVNLVRQDDPVPPSSSMSESTTQEEVLPVPMFQQSPPPVFVTVTQEDPRELIQPVKFVLQPNIKRIDQEEIPPQAFPSKSSAPVFKNPNFQLKQTAYLKSLVPEANKPPKSPEPENRESSYLAEEENITPSPSSSPSPTPEIINPKIDKRSEINSDTESEDRHDNEDQGSADSDSEVKPTPDVQSIKRSSVNLPNPKPVPSVQKPQETAKPFDTTQGLPKMKVVDTPSWLKRETEKPKEKSGSAIQIPEDDSATQLTPAFLRYLENGPAGLARKEAPVKERPSNYVETKPIPDSAKTSSFLFGPGKSIPLPVVEQPKAEGTFPTSSANAEVPAPISDSNPPLDSNPPVDPDGEKPKKKEGKLKRIFNLKKKKN